MKRASAVSFSPRVLRSLSLVALALAAVASCSKVEDTQDYIPSQRGAVQPDAGGDLLSEADACDQLASAESSARKALGCGTSLLECPGSIRPAGGAACFQYSEASVEGCAALYDTFVSCEEFAQHPCLISAVAVGCDAPPVGEAGAGGAPSTPTEEAGAGGLGGAAGEAAAGAGGAP